MISEEEKFMTSELSKEQVPHQPLRFDPKRMPEIPGYLSKIVNENWQIHSKAQGAGGLGVSIESYWAMHCLGILDGLARNSKLENAEEECDAAPARCREMLGKEAFWKRLASLDERQLSSMLPAHFLREIAIACRVADGWIDAVWEFQFENMTKEPRIPEAAFPFPEDAAIKAVQCLVGDDVLDAELQEAGEFFQGCEEVSPGIICIRPGVLNPGERSAVRIVGSIPIHPSGFSNELLLPLGLPLPAPKGELLIRADRGAGIFPDTTKTPQSSRTSPPIQVICFPKLRISVDIPRGYVVPETIISGTHEIFVYLNQSDIRAVLPLHMLNFGDSFRLRWATPPKDRVSRVTSGVDGQHKYHILRLYSPQKAATPNNFKEECTIVVGWLTEMTSRERQLALDCLAVAVASLNSETKLQLCVLGRDVRWFSEEAIAVSQFPIAEVLSQIRDSPTGRAETEFIEFKNVNRLWIGPAPSRIPLFWESKPGAIFIAHSRPHHHEEWLRALGLAASIFPGDSPAEIVPPLVGRIFHQNWKASIDGTIGIEKPSYDYDFRIALNDSLVFLTRTDATVTKLGIKLDPLNKMELEVRTSDWEAPQLLWARSRSLYAGKHYQEEVFKETRETHGILTPRSMFATQIPEEIPPGTRRACNPMP
jgi:hypothetical protein